MPDFETRRAVAGSRVDRPEDPPLVELLEIGWATSVETSA